MNKLYPSFVAMFLSANVFALSPLEQAKVDTVEKVYQTNDLEGYSTREFADLQMKATDIHNENEYEYGGTCLSEFWIYGMVRNQVEVKPIIKIINEQVNVTLKNKKKIINLVYQLECKNNQCLVSDVITKQGYSYKKNLASCIKQYQ
ncbi:hypothetical protein [Pasteurella bettyae]|uniref:Uncharacterized protein n=1 Tax=Pasteurella bettyae CCUG 2042 TaxID=1095749 RepID=I3DHB8_9PAST|nr:hypothetical protein [Pasteurella bettyae]EIJ71111.1 hypothetical protein HMPREF1052_2199 [Pasteurella bettyae CCUG 2042]SUB22618.1 Uncharacterised protein [Pasteurella bettyae]